VRFAWRLAWADTFSAVLAANMIYYSTETWREQIFRFKGTVWVMVWWKVLGITLYTLLAYEVCRLRGENLGAVKNNILGSTLSFLLVFRANNAYSRYWQGRTLLTTFFCDLREIISLSMIFLPGGKRSLLCRWQRGQVAQTHEMLKEEELDSQRDLFDFVASEERTDVLRWSLILAVSLQMHTRILDEGLNHGVMSAETKWLVDWDRFRIRNLTTAEEFRELDTYVRALIVPQHLWDEPKLDRLNDILETYQDAEEIEVDDEEFEVNTVPAMRLPVVVIYKITEVLVRNMNDAKLQNKKYGITERFVPFLTAMCMKLMNSYSMVNQAVSTPLPFPYFHLCKTLLFMYFLMFPFFVDEALGFWANIGETCVLCLALLGVDAIATELENPFGDDDNDLDIYEKISSIEQEMMFFLKLSGDTACEQNFMWQEMPEVLTAKCVSPVPAFLVLRAQAETGGKSEDVVYGGKVSRTGLGAKRKPSKGAKEDEEEDDDDDSGGSDDSA